MQIADGRVVSNFIVQALKGDDITVYGDGNQTRSFCYGDDLMDGFVTLMHSQDDFSGPINLGNPVEIRVEELAAFVIELTQSSSNVIRLPRPVDDPRQRQPNIDKAKKHLGWNPIVSLEQGLMKTISYFADEMGVVRPYMSSPERRLMFL